MSISKISIIDDKSIVNNIYQKNANDKFNNRLLNHYKITNSHIFSFGYSKKYFDWFSINSNNIKFDFKYAKYDNQREKLKEINNKDFSWRYIMNFINGIYKVKSVYEYKKDIYKYYYDDVSCQLIKMFEYDKNQGIIMDRRYVYLEDYIALHYSGLSYALFKPDILYNCYYEAFTESSNDFLEYYKKYKDTRTFYTVNILLLPHYIYAGDYTRIITKLDRNINTNTLILYYGGLVNDNYEILKNKISMLRKIFTILKPAKQQIK